MFIYVPACIGLIAIVLLQQGKGGGFGGALGGGGGTDTVFGTKSAQTLPVKITYAGATLFMTIAIILSVLSGRLEKGVAPDLIELSESDPTLQDSRISSGTMENLGLGTAVTNASAHDDSATPAATPVVTQVVDETTTEAPTDEGSSDDAE
jgi:preprotein translocase subunit SecG